MKSMYVAELAVGDDVSELFAVRSVEYREFSSGKMVSLELVDRTGRIKGIIWDAPGGLINNLKTDTVYKVTGSVTTYKGDNQITVTAIKPCEEFDADDFIPRGELSYDELNKKLEDAISGIKDSDYQKLLKELFSDSEIRESFLNGVGGKLWHHNYVGGLAEHSFSMFELCGSFCENYKELDRDLILAAAILHDIGKIRSYSLVSAIDYTSEGRLLGHIVIGDEIVREAIARLDNFPAEKALKLRHLILSHQGTLEQASPVVPMMPEGYALYAADLLDSKLAALRRIRKKEKRPGVEWSSFVNLLNSFLYFGSEEEENG